MGRSFFNGQSLHSRAILLFTDGNDNQSQLDEAQFYEILKALDVPVFVVGIADGFLPTRSENREKLGMRTLQDITALSGGKLFVVKDISQLPEIAETLRESLRPQYLLTMTVERGAQERRHEIEVKLKGRKSFRIRHRTGYIGMEPDFIGGNK